MNVAEAEIHLSQARRALSIARAASKAADAEDTAAMSIPDRLEFRALCATRAADVADADRTVVEAGKVLAAARTAQAGADALADYDEHRHQLLQRLQNTTAPFSGAVAVERGSTHDPTWQQQRNSRAQFPETDAVHPADRAAADGDIERLITYTLDRAGITPPAGSEYQIASRTK